MESDGTIFSTPGRRIALAFQCYSAAVEFFKEQSIQTNVYYTIINITILSASRGS